LILIRPALISFGSQAIAYFPLGTLHNEVPSSSKNPCGEKEKMSIINELQLLLNRAKKEKKKNSEYTGLGNDKLEVSL
jgi:hypothetical protein